MHFVHTLTLAAAVALGTVAHAPGAAAQALPPIVRPVTADSSRAGPFESTPRKDDYAVAGAITLGGLFALIGFGFSLALCTDLTREPLGKCLTGSLLVGLMTSVPGLVVGGMIGSAIPRPPPDGPQ